MNMNETPSSERVHIAFFGRRNSGKSSLVNAVTNQPLSLVSEVKGTTTDPVKKAMELLPLGPVVIIDTPGIDDEGALGEMRVRRAEQVLEQTDIAVLVTDARPIGETPDFSGPELELIRIFRDKKIPFLIAWNKADLRSGTDPGEDVFEEDDILLNVSALTGENVEPLKEKLAELLNKKEESHRVLVSDLISPGELVLLVIPIDDSAPKARLILPQQQVIRDILDAGGCFAGCQPRELADTLAKLSIKPALVITDSQVFGEVAKILPEEIPLTSFSILFARYKGDLDTLSRGAEVLRELRDGDRVLISEGCTHHRQCNDIGTVKLPMWVRETCGAEPLFSFTSGGDFPEDLSFYRLIIHCGGCMLQEKEMRRRMDRAEKAGVPMVNYGVAIACANGVLERSMAPLKKIRKNSSNTKEVPL